MLQALWNGCVGISINTAVTIISCCNIFLLFGMLGSIFSQKLADKYGNGAKAVFFVMYLLIMIVCNITYFSGQYIPVGQPTPSSCSFVIMF